MYKIILLLENELKKKLPGKNAQQMLMPEGRMLSNINENKVNASVLILLYPNIKGEVSTVLIKRPIYNGHHSGQISFPGGKLEPSDKNFEITALRESKEEIGINPDEIRIIGTLTELYIPISNFLVHPYVGYTLNTPYFLIDKSEVEYIIEFPVKILLSLEIKNRKQIIFDKERNIPYFEINKEIVWGATSMILNEFIQLIRKCMR